MWDTAASGRMGWFSRTFPATSREFRIHLKIAFARVKRAWKLRDFQTLSDHLGHFSRRSVAVSFRLRLWGSLRATSAPHSIDNSSPVLRSPAFSGDCWGLCGEGLVRTTGRSLL
jgi:hypothetical protein